jgi:TrpR family trp operon transcriptional repressor
MERNGVDRSGDSKEHCMDTDFDELIRIFADTTDENLMRKLFDELLTPHEREAVALRWNLMKQLYQGVPQREIASKLGISLCKITRGSKILKDRTSYCRRLMSDRFDDHLHI